MSSSHRQAKMLRKILVVKSETVYKDKIFEGFCDAKEVNLEPIILENFEYQIRGEMEEDPSFQQPIPYAIIHNPKTNKIVAYQRGSDESKSGESRLYGKRSLGVGGHIEWEEKDEKNPLHATVIKEIEEEINLTSITGFSVLGYINDNSNDVGKVHLGVLYLVTTDETTLTVGDGELARVEFMSFDQIEEIMESPECDVESRSKIAWKAYKDLYSQ